MLSLTEKSIEKFQEILKERNAAEQGIRLFTAPGG